MPSSTLFLATLLGVVLGILLGGALGGLLGGFGAFLMMRVQQLDLRIRALEQVNQTACVNAPIDETTRPPS